MTKRYFPCWVCKGSGIIEKGDTQDGIQISADLECGLCEGEGMVEIRGRIHKKMRAFQIGMLIMTFKPEPWELGGQEIEDLGRKALSLLDASSDNGVSTRDSKVKPTLQVSKVSKVSK